MTRRLNLNKRRRSARALCLLLGALGLTPGPGATPAAAGCDRSLFKIVVDVGHSREAPGARSARGTPEYDFNLRLSQRILNALKDAGFASARLMISDGRGRRGLLRRAARVNSMGAALLLSVHHDSVQNIYLKRWTFAGRTQWFSDRFHGYSLFVSKGNRHDRESLRFAMNLGDSLRSRGLAYTAHHAEPIKGEQRDLIDSLRGVYRYDELIVLTHTEAPAVLLEAGVLVNRDEEEQLASPERRRRVAEAAAEAVGRYCGGLSFPDSASKGKAERP